MVSAGDDGVSRVASPPTFEPWAVASPPTLGPWPVASLPWALGRSLHTAGARQI